jgi:hypothetical protein
VDQTERIERSDGIGIGRTLRTARVLRGKSIEEASRETRIRADYLQALERERFDALLGEVYVRGFLRSYSTYLGLDPSKVLTVYNRHFGTPRPTLPEQPPGPIKATPNRPHLPHPTQHHVSWGFLIGLAVFVLAVLGAVGILSRSKSAPPPVTPASPGSVAPLSVPVTVAIHATAPVTAWIKTDGGASVRFNLRKGEERSFEGTSRIDVRMDHGGSARITVNGHPLGAPGDPATAYSASFGPQDFRRSPSASSASP